MKHLLVLSLALNGLFLVDMIVSEPELDAQQIECAEQNGDVNGDGMLDISDPIQLLFHLFGDAEAPAPTCDMTGPVGLPDTGQTLCYDVGGAETPCDSEIYPGQDGDYRTGCPLEGRFVDNEDGTVTDTCTGLMWLKDPTAEGSVFAWSEALLHCENLELGGYEDWRLPSIRELESVVDFGQADPATDPVFGQTLGTFWTSTSFAGAADVAWLIDFIIGRDALGDKADRNSVWAVRSAP